MNDPSHPPLLIVGCSVRAAVASALRAGFSPWAFDQFGDADLRAMAPVEVWSDDPNSPPDAWSKTPLAPWLYTGGLENRPELIERLAATRVLLGNDASVVRRVRDPIGLQHALAEAGLPSLAVRRAENPPLAGDWLRKPLRSGGGRNIRTWKVESRGAVPTDGESIYFQQRLPDEAPTFGATYIMARGDARLLGVCRHLRAVAGTWGAPASSPYLHGGAATYALCDADRNAVMAIGRVIADRFALSGVAGIDLARHEGRWYVLEVNPRYPASAQLLDDVGPSSVVGMHVAAAAHGKLPDVESLRPALPGALRVAYASRPFVWTAERLAVWRRLAPTTSFGRFELADLPCDGTSVEPGQPVCTFLARDRSGLTEVAHRKVKPRNAELGEVELGSRDCGKSEPAEPATPAGDELDERLRDWMEACATECKRPN